MAARLPHRCDMALILVIDDDDTMRRMVRRILEAAGHEIVEAADGNQGTRLFAERKPELVVTDIVMPDKEGIETILDIRKIDDKAKIIAVSGGGVDIGLNYLGVAGKLGATAVLAKPFRVNELNDLVTVVLNGGQAAA
jgi:DNA-binding response OmpR family regulator